jgi:hypothetical protein
MPKMLPSALSLLLLHKQGDKALLYFTLGQLAEALPTGTDTGALSNADSNSDSSSSSRAASAMEWYAKAVEHSSSSDSGSSSSTELQQTITVPALLAVARLNR